MAYTDKETETLRRITDGALERFLDEVQNGIINSNLNDKPGKEMILEFVIPRAIFTLAGLAAGVVISMNPPSMGYLNDDNLMRVIETLNTAVSSGVSEGVSSRTGGKN